MLPSCFMIGESPLEVSCLELADQRMEKKIVTHLHFLSQYSVRSGVTSTHKKYAKLFWHVEFVVEVFYDSSFTGFYVYCCRFFVAI